MKNVNNSNEKTNILVYIYNKTIYTNKTTDKYQRQQLNFRLMICGRFIKNVAGYNNDCELNPLLNLGSGLTTQEITVKLSSI